MKEIQKVEKRRIFKSTFCNERSSKSHCMIILDVPTVGGCLMLVDMAGFENIEQAGQTRFAAKMQIAVYTISTWSRTIIEKMKQLIGRSAPSDFLAKLTYLIWIHHEIIKHIDMVRAYTFGSHYFMEVYIVLSGGYVAQQSS
uniref:Cation efflux family protein n=1 Tax=Tanacetum cinerariifolium TaxID=118510 RepID=A0A6L2KDN5_TANCI|nr:cation efflux family protein [Tanacetum cinerariifolium]